MWPLLEPPSTWPVPPEQDPSPQSKTPPWSGRGPSQLCSRHLLQSLAPGPTVPWGPGHLVAFWSGPENSQELGAQWCSCAPQDRTRDPLDAPRSTEGPQGAGWRKDKWWERLAGHRHPRHRSVTRSLENQGRALSPPAPPAAAPWPTHLSPWQTSCLFRPSKDTHAVFLASGDSMI